MKSVESIKSALYSLSLNKVRSFLTMLGVIIGVFSVVILVSITKGFKNYIEDQFNSLGSNILFVLPGQASFTGDPAKAFTDNKLDFKHIDLIEQNSGEFKLEVAPNIEFQRTVKYKSNTYLASITGETSNAAEIFDINVDNGAFYTPADDKTRAKVAVIGPEVAKNLFKSVNPVGKTIKIDDTSFKVVGVFRGKGQGFDEYIYMPASTVKDVFGIKGVTSISMKVMNSNNLEAAQKQIEYALLTDLDRDDFTVMTQKDILDTIQNVLKVLSIGLSAIAAISLVVGGIGIMNIMLVSVTERTREIGLRKALGATSKDIVLQFMFEALFISVCGGLLGLLCAYALTMAIQSLVRAEITAWAVLLAVGFSIVVGLIFGTYPAYNAGRKDPVEALRFE